MNGLTKQYKITNCKHNQLNYSGYIGDLFNNPPWNAKVKVVWVDPMEWPKLGSIEEKEMTEEYSY